MTAAWPASIPFYAVSGSWQEEPEINIAKNELDMGTPIFRRRTQILSDKIKFTVNVSSTQYDILLDFYRQELTDGVLPFTVTDPRTQTTATYTFMDAPDAKAVAPYFYDVSMSVRRMP